jgi:cation:H+ antiporter
VTALLIVAGLAALLVGAELLVGGSSRLATWLGVPPMLVGLTVVSVGTSVPELAVGIGAAREGSPGLAVGNIAGTNLVNILCILGMSALIRPIVFSRRTLRFELPAMSVAAIAFYALSLDGHLGRLDGAVLLAGAATYTWLAVRSARAGAADAIDDVGPPQSSSPAPPTASPPRAEVNPVRAALALLLGIVVIIAGAEMLVHGAAEGARSLGVSDAVIGLTVVAIGTSAPELVTTIVSTLRGDRDIAIGNLLGSSVYNIALVLGFTVLVAPHGVAVSDELLAADLLLLVAATVATVPVFVTRSRLSRVEGGAFLGAYAGYVAWLLLSRT